jgi:hypothetical protein
MTTLGQTNSRDASYIWRWGERDLEHLHDGALLALIPAMTWREGRQGSNSQDDDGPRAIC